MKKITRIEPTAAQPVMTKTKVAAYCRVSTEADAQLVSLETQKSHYEELINANPDWVFAGLYYDEGISGTSKEKRPALQRMIADCEAGKIDRVLVKSLSRFARNTTDCLELTRKLLGLGVTIYFEKENLDTGSMESELLLSIMSSLAESESLSISENNKWGIRHRFENGTFKIASPPYGFDSKDGEMVINEEEASWVRWVYEQALSGKSSGAIARELNEKQVPTQRNGNWTGTTIRGCLPTKSTSATACSRRPTRISAFAGTTITASAISSIWKIIMRRSSAGKTLRLQEHSCSSGRGRRTSKRKNCGSLTSIRLPRCLSAESAAEDLSGTSTQQGALSIRFGSAVSIWKTWEPAP